MRLEVKVENLGDDDLALQIESYTRRLLDYPLRAVLKVIRRWPDENRFWPAWQELRAEVESASALENSRALLEGPTAPLGAQIRSDCGCWVCKLEKARQNLTPPPAASF